MSAVVEAITTALTAPLVSAPTYVDGGNINVLWMSADGLTVYGGRGANGAVTNNALRSSTNDGSTWTVLHTFTDPVIAMCDAGDGEVLVGTYLTVGNLWKSSGWATNPATATWTLVLTSSGTSCYFSIWALHQWTGNSAGRMIVNEYGPQTASPFTGTYATKVWMSADFGATWAVVFDLATQFPSTASLHMHGCAYDKWADRWWITWGDGGTGTTPNPVSGIAYSDNNGASWTLLTGLGSSNTFQSVGIIPLKDCVLFSCDGVPGGVYRLNRTGYRTFGALQVAHLIRGGTGSIVLAGHAFQGRIGGGSRQPVFIPHISGSSAPAGGLGNAVTLMTYDGFTFYELTRDPSAGVAAANKGVTQAVGPTASGKVILTSIDARQTNYSRVTVTLPTSLPAAV